MEPRKLEDLHPGDRVSGTVTAVELAGAFVEFGAEVPGFIHISQLKTAKVNRVEEVLEPGQQLEVWVSRIDRQGRRVELSLIRPVTLKWSDLKPGMQLAGEVIRIEPFGAFVEIGAERPGLLHVSEISEEYVQDPRDQLQTGEQLTVTVLEVDRKKKQIRLSLKAAQPEPDPEAESEPPLPTAMELAIRKALDSAPSAQKAGRQKAKGEPAPSELEDILNRTLSSRPRSTSGGPSQEK